MTPEKRQAFTLVEMMIVVLILGALSAIVIPRVIGGTFQARIKVCQNNVDTINKQIELYYANTGSWPIAVKDLINDTNYFPDGPPKCPFKIPYVMVTTNGVYRVSKHVHLAQKEVKMVLE
jgi:prepilin-type N-terminal cleavage/methylation domain-containing protein